MPFGGSARGKSSSAIDFQTIKKLTIDHVVCLGQNIARLELLHAVTKFFKECPEAELASSTTANSMDIVDFFVIKPKAGICEIQMGK